MIDVLNHPSWADAGWTRASVVIQPSGETRAALVHADAPGLAVIAMSNHLSVTHVPTGLDSAIFPYYYPWVPCAPTLRDTLRAVCAVLDYASLTHEAAARVPADTLEQVRALAMPLRMGEHTCDACAWWEAARLPGQIAELEAARAKQQEAVYDAEAALDDATADLADLDHELSILRAKAAKLVKP